MFIYIAKLVEIVLEKLCNLKITKESFADNYDKLKRDVESYVKQQPRSQCNNILNHILSDQYYSFQEKIKTLKEINYDALIKLYNTLFDKIFIEGLIYGNCNANSVKTYTNLITKYIIKKSKKNISFKDIQKQYKGILNIDEANGDYIFRFKSPNDDEKNSCTIATYLLDINYSDSKSYSIAKLYAHLIKNPFFLELRTKQQLGYSVTSYLKSISGYFYFGARIQGNNKDPIYVDKCINKFLNEFKNNIQNMTDELFIINKESLITKITEKSKSIYEEFEVYWNEITSNRYQFTRIQNIAKIIKNLTKNDILGFMKYIIADIKKKVVIQCFGNTHKMTDEHVLNEDDILKLKQKVGYKAFPLMITNSDNN